MKLTKLIVAAALSAFALTTVNAAPLVAPATSMAPGSAIELVQAKKKAAPKKAAKKKVVKKKAAKGKKVAKKGPGKCGAMNYWNKKQKKCVSKA